MQLEQTKKELKVTCIGFLCGGNGIRTHVADKGSRSPSVPI
jgi:hypothetical protein